MEILNGMRTIRPIIGLVQEEQMFTAKLFYFLVLMGITAIMIRIVRHRRDHSYNQARYSGPKAWLCENDILLLAAVGMVVAYMIIYRWFENGKYVHDRLLFFGFLLYLTWLGVQKFPRWFSGISVGLALTCCLSLGLLRYPLLKMQEKGQSEFIQMADQVPEESVIYPVNFSGNWMQTHWVDYMGTEKSLVVLENYECEQRYFPLRWKLSAKELIDRSGQGYPQVWNVDSAGCKTFDYLVTFAEIDAADRLDYIKFRLWANKNYKVVATSASGLVRLYKPL
jgi:hypothetical protein